MKQVLINLIGNALKFTNQGSVSLLVEELSREEKISQFRFSVVDTGIGLPPDKQKTIFESFSQADGSTARQYGGTGLGLTISNQLVNLMGGKFGLKSVPKKGSTFYFEIPMEISETKLDIPEEKRKIRTCCKEMKILLVEDNFINQELAKILLDADGERTTVAENGIEALEYLSENDYDIVFMDMQMPEMDGVTATEVIRAVEIGDNTHPKLPFENATKLIERRRGNRIPIIAMTANVMENDKQICKNAGMDDFLSKPFIPDDIFATLEKFAKRK